MAKRTTEIAIPMVLVGVFAAVVFLAIGSEQSGPVFYIVILFLAVFVFFFGLATGQNLTSPLQKLLGKAKELSEGNLSTRVYLETKDELAELADTFNKIAEELETSHEQEVNSEKSVGIKVQAKTQELEETISALEQKVKNRTIELERLVEESNKLQTDVKEKEEETTQLRKELNDLNQKISKRAGSKG